MELRGLEWRPSCRTTGSHHAPVVIAGSASYVIGLLAVIETARISFHAASGTSQHEKRGAMSKDWVRSREEVGISVVLRGRVSV